MWWLFVAEHFLGLGPEKLEEEDLLFMLSGADMPFVLGKWRRDISLSENAMLM